MLTPIVQEQLKSTGYELIESQTIFKSLPTVTRGNDNYEFCKAMWLGDLNDELTSLITRVRVRE